MAMEPEVAALRARMTGISSTTERGEQLTRGELAGHPVTAVLCGIGKVAAASAATAVAATDLPHVLISAGVAGSVRPDVATGSLLVVSGAVEHDYDLRPFVADRAHGFGGPRAWPASDVIVAARHDAPHLTCDGLSIAVHDAWAATGDHVVTDREKHGPIRDLGAAVACVDMETSAIAYVATALDVPWAGLRVISDGADEHLDV